MIIKSGIGYGILIYHKDFKMINLKFRFNYSNVKPAIV